MKVLFLDHDGVTCLRSNWGSRSKKKTKAKIHPHTMEKDIPVHLRLDDFDKKCIKVLNEILSESGAEIVISSDWKKYATLEELQRMYKIYGVNSVPIDVTPLYANLDRDKEKDFMKRDWAEKHAFERSMEIQNWLSEHPEVTHWVAVDDLYMAKNYPRKNDPRDPRDWGLDNFVWTPNQYEGIKQSGVKEKILKYFKDE